jgi:antitoxin ParD1/3/4
MGKNTFVTLGDHFGEFVDQQVEGGHYSSASEVIRAGLRLLEEREAGVQALRAALTVGESSGPATAFDFEAFIEGKRDALP